MFFINPFIYAAGADFESIATVTAGSGGAANFEFTNIPSTYQHLQIRWLVSATASGTNTMLRPNGDTSTSARYASHSLEGNGSSVSAGFAGAGQSALLTGVTSTSQPSVHVIDLLDYTSTSKNKTIRVFSGFDNNGSGSVFLWSGVWMQTTAITTLRLFLSSAANLPQHSTAALYGIKAP